MQENEFELSEKKGAGRGMIVAFVIGLVIGVVGTLVAQPFLGRRLPEAVRGKYEVLQGPVSAKQLQDERLLLTVSTSAGAILATFKKQVEEINLLVEKGDTVALDVPGYQPFMENPDIIRVAKPDMPPATRGPAGSETEPTSRSQPAATEDSVPPDTVRTPE
ncbi:MAG: hypothetical protein GWN99_02860 [Gemmatimonadetes bacterium]|uniref:Uncharacterized protein n=1 Tax=Candidatus Kutchimonas denitrificans TaxID=3056748 RepID=A0AAE5C8X5_9BACT|nr:hypothetical protein [Gemmatimonadota bacterium]NIR74896.1 hypothetical protein [Candidatus Kutchimonas denitrificans]NIS00008.1 hypothetical protein [Gemmatimonadota bacterium]NIT65591.1 hypothetical protein [Gemmatimonadota bacterium]NIU52561.1 hypothetical protein [Gemmatimonadota bacterium]